MLATTTSLLTIFRVAGRPAVDFDISAVAAVVITVAITVVVTGPEAERIAGQAVVLVRAHGDQGQKGGVALSVARL